ncbi:DNA-binding proteins Bright/BRCAA1/RBP1 and proteins containing BRIGHT domain [Vermiconidia calcicola]|uniref:DNA-binding proteins Bright/BRCAA1/RBP1 and proteins containing BRIGHT domain n=1 Tax=Vermiconidia calcicola TaxID=1690605 RepID=A0ACC3NXK1_9PEZI|nr:DNA-binding proteins Bright/BRCAA1/RBP1 and proteins containing BRIGHT domain [Vermiconidia calcicola]
MAQAPTNSMAIASPTPYMDIPYTRDAADNKPGFSGDDKLAATLLTPPNSISPNLSAHAGHTSIQSPPSINIEHENELQDPSEQLELAQDNEVPPEPAGTPLSKGALSGLDAAAAITPAMLAKHHLPGIMLGNGPRPIRYVMGELTQSVPGFSRIPPAKARRLVVAALEGRHGGGPDGNVAFCKTGWGRWDAHIKGSSRDSGVGSFHDGHLSPPRSERSSYAASNRDSGVHMRGPRMPSAYRDHNSGGSWTASSLREEDELAMDMDVPENEADKMSLDDGSVNEDDSSSMNDDTDDDDWAAVGPDALRKASLPTPGAPRLNYNALSIQRRGPSSSWARRPSAMSQRSFHSSSLPQKSGFGAMSGSRLDPSTATPEEKAAVAALMSLGASM